MFVHPDVSGRNNLSTIVSPVLFHFFFRLFRKCQARWGQRFILKYYNITVLEQEIGFS